ncbi:MAG: KaiC 1 [Armatimonadetes bacterium CG_4_10_14_0_8_um_filter_66_14]|nr:circadian clock protein KaiC [Armatimonadota bacterium]NCQ28159.1 circadian clock protein KaiC [Armatimonadota bacterium]PIZ29509.1 MAG: KaiC 1 [Armatimonadetes bacterium CG_4_10_14_0_8_um_filter_66_14]
MRQAKKAPETMPRALAKSPTGIQGLDEVTEGGLPTGRPTLVCGSAGCGKTLLAIEFLVRGAVEQNEPGVFVAFEETEEELTKNVASLGFDLNDLVARKKILLDHVHLERNEIQETGEYDLEGLFIRLGYAIDSIGAQRVVLDTIESLFAGLSNHSLLRSELRRLFRWLKDKGVTAIITGERGEGTLTRQGLEEYVSDCVILLDHRLAEQISTRRLRIIKYRGSTHGTNEYPFLIDENGISVMPVTSLGLDHPASMERISTGIPRLDAMLGGKGYYRGSSVLVSGTAGTGKTSVAAHFAEAACRRKERCLFFCFEESRSQILRNMRSIGMDLEPHVQSGLLEFVTARPTLHGLETHLALIQRAIREFKPGIVVMDPITNFLAVGTPSESKAMLMRLVDFLKSGRITALVTSLTESSHSLEQSEVGLSSLIDTWLLLRDLESNGERNRGLYIIKARGLAHSNQIREFVLTDHGAELVDVYLGPEGILTGSARVAQEAQDRRTQSERQQEIERKRLDLKRKRETMQAQIAVLQAELEAEEAYMQKLIAQEETRETGLLQDRAEMARSRKADPARATGAAAKKTAAPGRKPTTGKV